MILHSSDVECRVIYVSPNTGWNLDVRRVSTNRIRIDSLAFPEFYVECNLRSMSQQYEEVDGRFSDRLFPGGLSARPLARWTGHASEVEVVSPEREVVIRFVV